MVSSLTGYLAISGDTFDCHDWGGAGGIKNSYNKCFNVLC